MPLANCRKCRKLFNKVLRDTCEECARVEDVALAEVRAFLRDHPNSSAGEIESETGVRTSLIMQFARTKQIALARDESSILRCRFCGRELSGGEICKLCQLQLTAGKTPAPSDASVAIEKRAAPTGSGSNRRAASDSAIKAKFSRR